MSNDVRTLANRFIALDILNGKKTPHIRIHKLCFLAHGWSLALQDRPITVDEASLYKFGPVYDKIYKSCISVGSGNISTIHNNDIFHNYHDRGEVMLGSFSKEDEALIDAVYNTFKDLEPWQLSVHVNNEERPWFNKAKRLREGERITLGNDEIRKDFVRMSEKYNLEQQKNERNMEGNNHTLIKSLKI